MGHFLDTREGTLVCAHRGHSVDGHENSPQALRMAAEKGADLCEIDLRLSSDGVMVVFHDTLLDETATGSGPVASHDWATLSGMRHRLRGSGEIGEPISRVEDILDLAQSLPLNWVIEIKDEFALEQVQSLLGMVNDAGLTDRVLYSSFDLPLLKALRVLQPASRTLGLLHCRVVDPVAVAQAAGVAALTMEVPNTAIEDAHKLAEAGLFATHLVRSFGHYASAGTQGGKNLDRLVQAIADRQLGILFCDDVDWGHEVRSSASGDVRIVLTN